MSDRGSEWSTKAQQARDVIGTLTGSEEMVRALSGGLHSRGALGELGHYNGFGGIWGRSQLSRRDRSLVVIAFQVAFGRQGELRFHANGGLNHGLTVEEIDETILQIATYAGAATGIDATAAVNAVIAQREGTETRSSTPARLELKDPEKRRADALDVLRTLLAHLELSPEQIEAQILESQGYMGELVLGWAFGDVWSRPQLSRRDRGLVVVAALAALGLTHELEIHVQGALNHGVTREEIMITLVLYGGFPRAIDGLRTAQRALGRADAADRRE